MRRVFALFFLAVMLAAPASAHAQLGGLKKKLKDKVTGTQPETPGASGGAAQPKCDKSTMVITNDVVDRYLRAVAARDAEFRKMAGEPGATGQYYAAWLRNQEAAKRKAEWDLRRGADWERYKVLYTKGLKGDQASMTQMQALLDTLNSTRDLPELDWQAQQQGNKRIEKVMMDAADIPFCDWSGNGIGDRLPMLVSVLAQDPNTKDFRGYGTPVEGAAVKARLKDLTTALNYPHTPTEAEKAHVKEEDEKLQQSMMTTGDPYTDCLTKASSDFMKKHQAELQKAADAKDMSTVMRLTSQQQQEAMAACKSKAKNNSDDD